MASASAPYILSDIAASVDNAIVTAKQHLTTNGNARHAFDVRGKLYALAHNIAPHARDAEITTLKQWLAPTKGERYLDIACGSGFVTQHLSRWANTSVYALDPSVEQLNLLSAHIPTAIPIHGTPEQPATLQHLHSFFDAITSIGGIHHIHNQQAMFSNIALTLKPAGRIVIADVSAGTRLATYFDSIVTHKCLTGHEAIWLSPERITTLTHGLPLKIKHMTIEPTYMDFTSNYQMGLFYKCLHAYDASIEEVIDDLEATLGVKRTNGIVQVSWPLLYATLEKIDV